MSHGIGVQKVDSREALEEAVEALWAQAGPVVLVQERISGRDFRLDFVGETFIGGYERRQVVLRGDGRRTVLELLAQADARWRRDGFARRMGSQITFPLSTVPPAGDEVPIGSDTILNLNRLATAEVIEELPEAWRRACLAVGAAVGACHFGVDLRAPGLDHDPGFMVVLEVNDSPMLTGLFELGHEELAIEGQCRALRMALGDEVSSRP